MNVIQALTDFQHNLRASGPVAARGGQPEVMHGVTAGAAKSGELKGKQGAAGSAMAAPASGAPTSTTITANDFLQLLVAEMKNQDPTATQDPNAYIDQLVQVNSLQQLISINQDLSGPSGSSGSKSAGEVAGAAAPRQPLGSAVGTPAAAISSALSPHSRPLSAGLDVGQIPGGGIAQKRDLTGRPIRVEKEVEPLAAQPPATLSR